MVLGYVIIDIQLFSPESLKEKRQIMKSLISKIKSNFNVSASEIGFNDKWQRAEIGISCISNDSKVINSTFNKIIDMIENKPDVEIINTKIEML